MLSGASDDPRSHFEEARDHAGAVPSEDLADQVRDASRAFEPDTWAWHAAGRLEEIAIPVLTGREPLRAGRVTAIRSAALCLAREPARAADPFRGVVAGITRMERAAIGRGHGGPQ